MLKGRGANRNPFLGRVTIQKTYVGYALGIDYKGSIESASKRMGNENPSAVLKKTWHKPTSEYGEWFSTDRKTESKVYLKLGRNAQRLCCSVETIYFVDGHLASDTERKAIEEWLPKRNHTMSSTQREIGLDSDHEQTFILPELSTVVLIKQNEREIRPQSLLAESVAPVPAYAVAR